MNQTHQRQFCFLWLKTNCFNDKLLQSIDEAANNLANELGTQVEHSSQNVKAITIPGIEEDTPIQSQPQQLSEQQQQPQQQQNQPQQQQQTENSIAESQNTLQDHSMMDVDNQIAATNQDNNQSNEQQEDDNMDMYFKDGEEEEEATDSFFNEMVNADDDPSVSEFLNTE